MNGPKRFYACERCGKVVPEEQIRKHANRPVGFDGNLMVTLAMKTNTGFDEMYRSVMLCPSCWDRVLRAVRKTLGMEKENKK